MTQHYSSPTASPSGTGTKENPIDFLTLLRSSVPKPGDEILLLDGKYKAGECHLAGVIIRPDSPARLPVQIDFYDATINNDKQFVLLGNNTQVHRIEFLNSMPGKRQTTGQGSWVAETDRLEPRVTAQNTVFAGCVFHDFNNGIAHQHQAVGGLLDSCLSYNNGWIGGDRPHGHGYYLQNTGVLEKILFNSIAYNNFDDGIDVYGSSASFIKRISLIKNSANANGKRNLVYVGETLIKDAVIAGNVLFQPPTAGVNGEDTLALSSIAEYAPTHDSLLLEDNFLCNGAIRGVEAFLTATVRRNTICGGRDGRYIDWIMQSGNLFQDNIYVGPQAGQRFMYNNSNKTWEEWKLLTQDNSTFVPTAEERYWITASRTLENYLHITIWNPQKKNTISVVWNKPAGTKFSLYSQYDPKTPVLSGQYNGVSLQVPIGAKPVPNLLGPTTPTNVYPKDSRFETFILEHDVVVPPVDPIDPPPPLLETYRQVFVDKDNQFYSLEPDGTLKRF